MKDLDAIGIACGTDKSSTISWAWDYLRHYERLFQRFKAAEINLIEIGVAGGPSIEMWLQFFERATIIGIDIDECCSRFARDRVVIKIGSQDNPEFLQNIASEYKPSIVIDDGSHLAHHMIASFEVLFPALVADGIYIFEDLAFHFEDGGKQWLGAKAHQGASDKPIYDYLSPFLRAQAAKNVPEHAHGFAKYAFENIDSITVFGGALAVSKKSPRRVAELHET